MPMWIQVPAIRPPAVGIKSTNPKRREQCLEFRQYPIRAAAKGIGHDPAGLMIQRLPQPPRMFLATHEGPHFVQLRFLDLTEHHPRWCSLPRSPHHGVHSVKRRRFFLRVLITVVGLTPSTRAVSRMPLPLSAISTICCLTSGTHPVLWYCRRKILRGQCRFVHRYRCAPLGCCPYFTTSQLPHAGHCTATTATFPPRSGDNRASFIPPNYFSTLPNWSSSS